MTLLGFARRRSNHHCLEQIGYTVAADDPWLATYFVAAASDFAAAASVVAAGVLAGSAAQGITPRAQRPMRVQLLHVALGLGYQC